MSEINTNKSTAEDSANTWYQQSKNAVLDKFSVAAEQGLSSDAVADSRTDHGSNELNQHNKVGIFGRLLRQFENPLIIILLVAGGATLLLGEYVDMTVIFAALLVNVIFGTIQEGRASKAFEALADEQKTEATVIRDGRKRVIPSSEVVVGDIVELDAGVHVPADMRLIDEKGLKVNEAALTGEWMSVGKQTEVIDESVPVTDRMNMAWKGTLVSAGEGRGVVVAVGHDTELGRIAEGLAGEDEAETPIQRNMRQVARFLSILSLVVVALIFILGVIRSQGIVEMLLVAIAVAVSIVPEGLPAAVTVVLAIGMEKILDKGGLVKNLRAAETLGSTTTIMTDKTGTLTQARMQIAELLSFDEISGSGGKEESEEPVALSLAQLHLLEGAAASSDAFIEHTEEGDMVRGRPIEKAIVARAQEAGINKDEVDERRTDFLAFSSENRYAASISRTDRIDSQPANKIFVSGAPEFILKQSNRVHTAVGDESMDDEAKQRIENIQRAKSAEGKRLIAVAYKPEVDTEIDRKSEGAADEGQVSDLIFLGLISFEDPIREDVAESIQQARAAGVHVLMVTGDNPQTASFIAQKAGIADADSRPLIGSDLEEMSDDEVVEAIKSRSIFARVLPNQKLRIGKLLRDRKEVVAMTGDGVNDAPALRAADIGVSVGSGTEVAKEASDLVLLDDSFSIIVSAIEEGRRIIDNLKKIIAHLLSAGFGEVFLITGALLLALPIPITAPQILWINIVQGGLLSFVFAFEPPAPDIMDRDPGADQAKHLITGPIKWLILASGTITGMAAFILYLFLDGAGLALEEIYTIMFFVLAIDTLFFTLSLKDFYRPIYKIDFSNNMFLFGALAFSTAAMLSAVFVPGLREFLDLTVPAGWAWWLLLGVGIFDLAVVEVAKYVLFQRRQNEAN